jgi:(heptosyl)LPS beta-1,4-glucosyltransferase
MMKISGVIITYNEERNIERCIRALMPVVDEIIVVDSFSTDRTEAICIENGVKFYQRKFDGYGSQKRFATDLANFEYVLSLDADEELSPLLSNSILEAKQGTQYDCYSFNRLNIYCGKPIRFCGWYPDKQVRLFNKKGLNWSTNLVHEKLVLDKYGLKTSHLKGDLLHYTCTTIEEHKSKEYKYSELNAQILMEKNRKVYPIIPYLKAIVRFIKIYILKGGFLDGYYGWVISTTLAYSSFRKYNLVRNKNSNKKN